MTVPSLSSAIAGAAAFDRNESTAGTITGEEPSAIGTARAPANKNQLKLLGVIRDAGNNEWLYIKDRETGVLYTVNTNTAAGIAPPGKAYLVSQTDDVYVIAINAVDNAVDNTIEYTLRRE
jgi:hypothetical protein